jgi:hypothetical protein
MRVKSHWFRSGAARPPEEVAGVVAFIAWKVAQNALRRMRKAGFDIDPGPAYFGFLAETLVYCVQVAWRLAQPHFDEAGALAFMTSLANRAGDTLADNHAELLGGEPAPVKAAFIAQVNAAMDDYGAFGFGPGGPDFGFMRLYASRVAELMVEKDQRWTHDQVIAIEAPEAAATIAKAFANLHDTDPDRRRRRTATRGD